jgi:hypothetical protein
MLILMLGAATSMAAEAPHIGYAYPAGGKQGTTIDVMVGGQFLEGATNVFVSGEGVEVVVLQHTVKYEQRELRQLFRRKENLLATIQERMEKAESYVKEERQLAQINNKIAIAELPEGVDISNQQQALRSLRQNGKEQFNPQIADQLRLRISVDENAESGARELRVYTPDGLSNPIFFEVGVLAEVLEEEPNDDHMVPGLQTIATPCIINGQILPGDIDHFRFKAEKGDSLVVNVAARRIIPYLADAVPGWFQAVVTIYDESGNEVAYGDDYKFNPDPVLLFDVPETGTYTLSIHDAIYRGRADFIYRIAVGELPFITGIFPLGAQEGRDVDIALSGRNLSQKWLRGKLPDEGSLLRQLSVKKGAYRSNQMPFAIGELPEITETEPNDSREQANAALLPITVNGRIQHSGDHDVFSFQGAKGDRVSIGVTARRLNSPLDSIIVLSGPGLETPIRNDDYMPMDDGFLHLGAGLVTHQADSYILQELPESGTYFIEIGDTQAKGGQDYAYRLRIAPGKPDFKLRMDPSGLQIAPGGTAVFTVRALRLEGFDGDITLAADELPEGFVMSHSQIPQGSDSTQITITAPRNMDIAAINPKISGSAEIDGTPIRRTALPVDDQMQAFLYRHLVPAQDLVLTAVDAPSPLSFEAIVPKSGIIELPLGEEVRIPLKGFVYTEKHGANISCDHPPPGLSVVKGWIGRKKDAAPDDAAAKGQVILKADGPLKPGDRATLVLAAVTKQGKQETRYPAPAISVKVVAPR